VVFLTFFLLSSRTFSFDGSLRVFRKPPLPAPLSPFILISSLIAVSSVDFPSARPSVRPPGVPKSSGPFSHSTSFKSVGFFYSRTLKKARPVFVDLECSLFPYFLKGIESVFRVLFGRSPLKIFAGFSRLPDLAERFSF